MNATQNEGIAKPRVALVTIEFEGPTQNGGIGTASRELAYALRDVGCAVEVFFVGPFHRYHEEYWHHRFSLDGIFFTAMRRLGVDDYFTEQRVIRAEVHRWLSDRAFDIVHFHEWLGLGLDALQAKRQGSAHGRTLMCTTLHGPTHWVAMGNGETELSAQQHGLSEDERVSVQHSDVVFSPSRFLLDHLKERGWRLPPRHEVRQNIIGPDSIAKECRPGQHKVTEIVFFGRLEKLKEIDLFCDAIDRLDPAADALRLSFLGRCNTIDGLSAADYVTRHARSWRVPWRLITDRTRDKALAYLSVPGRCAVMPSRVENSPYAVLECVARGIPFLAAAVGGTPELLDVGQRDHVLFEPTGPHLAQALAAVLAHGATAATPAIDFGETRRRWQSWHLHEAPAILAELRAS